MNRSGAQHPDCGELTEEEILSSGNTSNGSWILRKVAVQLFAKLSPKDGELSRLQIGETEEMTAIKRIAAILLLLVACVPMSSAQERRAANAAAAPPNLIVLVHQEIQNGKSGARQKLEVTMARICDRLEVPDSWIELQSLTGQREVLFFNPFDSYEDLERSLGDWNQLYATHADLARTHEELDSLVSGERTLVGVRRDDMGYLAESIDLSEARFMRVFEVRVFPGHEGEFAEALKILAEASAKTKADTPWVVYQVTLGNPSPAFAVLVPMSTLKQNDDLLSWTANLAETEGEETSQRLKQIEREAYAGIESNLYAISPEMSHVNKEFAADDPDFWRPKPQAEAQPDIKPSVKPTKKASPAKLSAQKSIDGTQD